MPRYRLGVLDQSPIAAGRDPIQAVAETLDLATRAEALGYGRYWVAEHHSNESFAGASPEVLMARIASLTSTIRVGAGGVMLMHYSALEVAERFRMLGALFPHRIDLGIGRAPGADPLVAEALARSSVGARADLEGRLFETKLVELIDYLRGPGPEPEPEPRIVAMPTGVSLPEPWLLGSGTKSAALAAKLGWAFCFAQFIGGASGIPVVEAYRDAFRPSPWLAEPRVAIGAFVLVAETTADADELLGSSELWFLRTRRGRRLPFPSPTQVRAEGLGPAGQALRRQLRTLRVHGDPASVRAKLDRLVDLYGSDELLVVTITHDHAARVRSYELLAELAEL